MSTKAINALIRWVSAQDVDDTAFDGTFIGPPITEARAELATIRRAAAAAESHIAGNSTIKDEHRAVLRSIAQEAE